MDFAISPELEDLRQRIAAFVETELLPLEAKPGWRWPGRYGGLLRGDEPLDLRPGCFQQRRP